MLSVSSVLTSAALTHEILQCTQELIRNTLELARYDSKVLLNVSPLSSHVMLSDICIKEREKEKKWTESIVSDTPFTAASTELFRSQLHGRHAHTRSHTQACHTLSICSRPSFRRLCRR